MFAGWLLLLALAAFQNPAPSTPAPSAAAQAEERAAELHNRGGDLFQQGRVAEGRNAILESLRIHTQLKKTDGQIINLRMLAFYHDGIGERQRSIEYYGRALEIARRAGNQQLEASTLRDLGVLYYNLDDNARAFDYLRQSLALQRRMGGSKVLAQTLFSVGEYYRYQGQLDAARTHLDEALEVARKSGDRAAEGNCLSALAGVDMRTSNAAVAGDRLSQALKIRQELKDARGEASTRLKLGAWREQRGEVDMARAELRQAVALFERDKYRGGEAFARQSLAMLERKAGNPDTAAAEMLRAVELAETLRARLSDADLRATYIGYVQNRYEFLIETYLELDKGDARRAFAISERARARAMVEALVAAGVKNAADRTPALTLEETQRQVLDAGTTLVEYSLGNDRSHLFVVTRDSVRHHALPGRAELEALARREYEAYRKPGARPDAAALARLLLPGVEAENLLVVADGALQYLPFADFSAAKSVVMAASATSLARPDRRLLPDAASVAVFADPVAPRLARLPFARAEAKSIGELAPAGAGKLVLGADATREAVLASEAKVLHIAAHSVLDTARPENTEVVLSGESLRLRDIHDAKGFAAELVVLSACQTALGKEMKREGMAGLASAFQRAGVPRVVASLWKVDDRATFELMKHFYDGMFKRGLSPALALRDAQRAVAAVPRWNHPFYWAGFVLHGEWR